METLVVFVAAIALMTLAGPVVIIASISKRLELGPIDIDLREVSTLGRTVIAIIGFALMLPVVVLAIWWIIWFPHTPMPTLTPTVAATPLACVCESDTLDDTLRCLIHTEAQAITNADLPLIDQIFASNAVIVRGDTGEVWHDAVTYYKPMFRDLDFSAAQHFDIRQIEVRDQTAYYTSGSSGSYSDADGTPVTYHNDSPSNHWVFERDDDGCWVITQFAFNAAHLDFP